MQNVTVKQQASKELVIAILNSGLFDSQYYLDQCATANIPVPNSDEIDLVLHYLYIGWAIGLNPSTEFSTKLYMTIYEDVANSKINPLYHYIAYGAAEGRLCFRADQQTMPDISHAHFIAYHLFLNSGLFDSAYYLQTYADVADAHIDPILHYIEHGSAENRNPSWLFDTSFYRRTNADIFQDNPSLLPLEHYIRSGRSLGKAARPPYSVTLENNANNDNNTINSNAPRRTYAIHAHLFYASVAIDIIELCASLADCSQFYFTTPDDTDAQFFRRYIAAYHPAMAARCTIILFPNLGRDIAPFVIGLNTDWDKYDYWCHIHTKYSPHTAFGHKWRAYLLDANIGSEQRVADIIALLNRNPDIGLLFPDHYFEIKKFVHIGQNERPLNLLSTRVAMAEAGAFEDFPAGSMFWARREALRPLFEAGLTLEDFDCEDGQLDATLAHAIERGFPLVALHAGYSPARFYAYPASKKGSSRYRKTAAEGTDPVGVKWLRDDPAIAKNERKALSPVHLMYNKQKFAIHWIIPDFQRGAGGHMTIFRFVSELSKRNHDQTIWIQNCFNHSSPTVAHSRINEWYQPLGDNVIVRFLPDDLRGISGDVVIATDCWTAYPCAQMTGFKQRFYFIQDYEPLFHPVGDLYYTALATYDFGFVALCAGKWLETIALKHGMATYRWDLAVDHSVYQLDKRSHDDLAIPEIAFYARQYTPRRLVGIGMAALDILAEMNEKFHVTFFGEELDIGEKNYDYKCIGIADSSDLAELYNRSTVGLVMSGTNYSLVPLEMMACGLPVVDVDVESTRAVYPEHCVALASPNPFEIARSLKKLLSDPSARNELATNAKEYARTLDWRSSVTVVEQAIESELKKLGKAVDVESLAKPFVKSNVTASILIPTFNGGNRFENVLTTVLSQKPSFSYDVFVIDSSSTDGTVDLLRKYAKNDSRLSVTTIDQAEFQHGKTRDLGIEQCRGSHVALLTQDALPASDEWLERLVGGFELDPLAAFVFGRHQAYPTHSQYTQHEIKAHFDWIYSLGGVFSRNGKLPSVMARGLQEWEGAMNFNSDNNTCVRKDVWKEVRYPHIDWGEDQLWSRICMELGFAKVYADDAVVFHSHDSAPLKQFDVAYEEGRLFRQFLGTDLVSANAFLSDLVTDRCRADMECAPNLKISPERILFHAATVLGRVAGQFELKEFLLHKMRELIKRLPSTGPAPLEAELLEIFKELKLA